MILNEFYAKFMNFKKVPSSSQLGSIVGFKPGANITIDKNWSVERGNFELKRGFIIRNLF